ncbi:MAG: protein-glutamate O-methyltransferase CheR [Pirellulales bacterium]|nr:protein-glutamate O-methyltransferase CheR [Pirellulales bacterium]
MPILLENEPMSDDQINRYTALIYKMAGIRISPQKRAMLSNRIRRRLKATGIDCFDGYLEQLQQLPDRDPEWDAFLQEVSTHETFLFRDKGQWDWFRYDYLTNVVKQAHNGKREKKLRIWSAACSTGDEAFTIAACIAATIHDCAHWKIKILGTDIGVQAIESARRAEFGEQAMHLVPTGLKRRFFDGPSQDKTWRAKPELIDWTSFRQHNLLNKLCEEPFDVVFLKNVLIYFDQQAKKQALQHIERSLKPGALLVTTAAEGIVPHVEHCDKIKTWLHQKR